MKIVVLLMLIGVIVGFSHVPGRWRAKRAVAVPPDSTPAGAAAPSMFG
jgi:hypothetical protein